MIEKENLNLNTTGIKKDNNKNSDFFNFIRSQNKPKGKREEVITLRLNEEEKDFIDTVAEAKGIKVSTYLRDLIKEDKSRLEKEFLKYQNEQNKKK